MASYQTINNLYKNQSILMFKECFALEKIDGCSCFISLKDNNLHLYNSIVPRETFTNFFPGIKEKLQALGHESIVIYGEGYGGKLQGRSELYGPNIKFIAFEVQINDTWLSVPNADEVCTKLGIEFVHYVRIGTSMEEIDAEKLKPSVQAIRNGISLYDEAGSLQNPKEKEGIVLRPLEEFVDKRGNRIIAKHKNASFSETTTKREVTAEDLKVIADAEAIARDWATSNRLDHVIQKLQLQLSLPEVTIKHTGDIIKFMIEDIKKESVGEIEWSKVAEKKIGTTTAILFKNRFKTEALVPTN